MSMPSMRPRRWLRSPVIAPMKVSGIVIRTVMIGSSSTGFALDIASRKAREPAILKATSDESTSWYDPS